MENTNNQMSSTDEHPQTASWQEYYEYAQQFYEAGDQEQAQAYYDIAQQLYDASGDDIGGQADVAQQSTPPTSAQPVPQQASVPPAQPLPQQASVPPAQTTNAGSTYNFQQPSRPPATDYTDINSIMPSVAPPPSEQPLSEEALNRWAEEYSSLIPDAFDQRQGSDKSKALMFSAIGLGVLIVISAGVYLYWRSQPTVVQSTAPISQADSTVDETQFNSSMPSSVNNEWNRVRQAGAVRHAKPRTGKAGGRKGKAKARSDDASSFSKQENIGRDPMGGLEL